MTDPSYTAVALVVDRSGSMRAIQEASQDAINEFIYGQSKQDGKRTVRLSQFDEECEAVFPSTLAADCPSFTLEPRGLTALLDAIGKTINDFGMELKGLPEAQRPGHVVVGIMTDGMENSSLEFSRDDIRRLVKHQEEQYGWHFLFMAANQDAVVSGAAMGMKTNSSITYSASNAGTRSVIGTMSGYVAMAAAGAAPEVTDEDRKKAAEK